MQTKRIKFEWMDKKGGNLDKGDRMWMDRMKIIKCIRM